MSTHIIHRVEGDLAPPVNFELVGQDITGWVIQLQGTYRDTFQPIDIAHTADVAADGKAHFDWGAADLVKGVADWEIFFTPSGGSPKPFTIPAENSLLLQVRGKKEPGPGVISGGGEQITIDQDGRILKIFGADSGGQGIVIFTTEVSLLASSLSDGTIAYAQDVDRFYKRAASVWEHLGVVTFPTEVALLAATPSDGTIAYAIDTDVFYFRIDGAWVAFSASTFTDPYTPPSGTFRVVGKFSVAGAGTQSEEFGDGAAAPGSLGLAVGNMADSGTGADNTAIGASASTVGGASATAAGKAAQAQGTNSSAFGAGANANVDNGTALGNTAAILAVGGVAAGVSARVESGHTNGMALGKGSQTTAANRATIGQVGGSTLELQVSGGFAANGATPQAAPSVTGSRGGNAAVASLLTVLDSIGIITDNTTA